MAIFAKMIQSVSTKLSLLFLLFYLKSNDLKCQSLLPYVERVKQYQLYVDSLINSYYSNPATSLVHGIIHYKCLNRNGVDSGYGSGGSADIYQNPNNKKIYQLSYLKDCDTIRVERTLYFIDNKIVLAIISDKEKSMINYYRDGKYLNIHSFDLTTKKFANRVLKEGYEVLKGFN